MSRPGLYTLSLHDALPIFGDRAVVVDQDIGQGQRRQELLSGRRGGVLAFFLARELVQSRAVPQPAAQERRSEEHTSELQSHSELVCRLLLEKKRRTTGRWT